MSQADTGPVNTQELFSLAVQHAQAGRISDAQAVCQQLLERSPEDLNALQMLGVLACQTGNLDAGVEHLSRALSINPDLISARFNLGNALLGLGRHIEAQDAFARVLMLQANHTDAHHALGVALRGQDRIDEAMAAYQRALSLNPNHVGALINLGNVLSLVGRHEEAVAMYQRLLTQHPNFPDALRNLGKALVELERFDDAAEAYEKAVRLGPGLADAQFSLGVLRLKQGRLADAELALNQALEIQPDYLEALVELARLLEKQEESMPRAEALYRRALELEPDDAQVRNALGNLLVNRGELEQGERAFRAVLADDPDNVDAYCFLGRMYEQSQRLNEADTAIGEALKRAPQNAYAHLFAAQIESRKKDYAAAVERLLKTEDMEATDQVRIRIDFELGRLYDRLEQSDNAYTHLVAANEGARRDWERDHPEKNRVLQSVELLQDCVTEEWLSWWSDLPAPSGPQPVFLVGFPRSGTTLLDQILDSHPQVVTLEEKPTLREIIRAFIAMPGGFPNSLTNVNAQQIEQIRHMYFDIVSQHVDLKGRMLIDKMPLNTANVGVIHRVFPEARYILAIRHPCDAIFSCFMQDFLINDSMANFFSIASTTNLYVRVMDLWRRYASLLPITYQRVRYEDLVEDMEGEARSLFKFLDIEWDEQVLAYRDHARQRGRINTPSYRQVSEPIYTHARYRWQRYATHFEPVMHLLRPFIEYFDYSE